LHQTERPSVSRRKKKNRSAGLGEREGFQSGRVGGGGGGPPPPPGARGDQSLSLSLSLSRCFPPLVLETFQERKRGQRWQILQLRINLGTYYLVVEEARCDAAAAVPLLLVFFPFFSPAVSNRQNWFLRV
jgi:hypothetical protein